MCASLWTRSSRSGNSTDNNDVVPPAQQQNSASDDALSIDVAMASYAQGDIVAFPRFVYFDVPQQKSKRLSFVEQEPEAIVILTQTCDVARRSQERPFIQVAPLVRIVDADTARRCQAGAHPRYAWVPASGADGFADLDRVATVTKRLLATCEHSRGLRNDDERREFARSIVRKFERFAFPDDLRDSLQPLRDRILEKGE
jgi:hypothetical protein